MLESRITKGQYGATIKINNHLYGLVVRSKWYELFLPFNSIYIGHEIGPQKSKVQLSRNKDSYIWGCFLGGLLADYFASHAFKVNTILMGISHMLFFLFGILLVGYWFRRRKQKWMWNRLSGDYPQVYMRPQLKAVVTIILVTIFTVSTAIFLIWSSFTDSIEDLGFIIGMLVSGAFVGLSGLFSLIPINQTRYRIHKIKYQGQEITVTELEQIIQELSD